MGADHMWFNIENNQINLYIIAKPNAKKTRLLSITEEALHISLHAKPKDGEANKELINFIAKLFKVPKSNLVLSRGEGSRHKQLIIPFSESIYQLVNNPEALLATAQNKK